MKKLFSLIFLAILIFSQNFVYAETQIPAPNTAAVVAIPNTLINKASVTEATLKTNAEIRQWYNATVDKIPKLNEQWIQEGISLEERAKKAHEIRHCARLAARAMMPNLQEIAALHARDQEKYGNPDGPTFAYLVEKNRAKGLQGEAVYTDIINSSDRTNKEYNEKYGVKKEEQSP